LELGLGLLAQNKRGKSLAPRKKRLDEVVRGDMFVDQLWYEVSG
jgi:hypothetical protein